MTHEGLHKNRLHPDAGNPLEQIYARKWKEENERRTGRPTPLIFYLLDGDVSDRDAEVAATVIQWLGSNLGRQFVWNVRAEYGG